MILAGPGRDRLHLGYSTNLWRGEDLDEVEAALRCFAGGIRRRLRWRGRLGLALHMGEAAARALARREARDRMAALLGELDLELFAVNAFPLRGFHGPRVKEKAFDPPWTTARRVRATVRIAHIAHALAPPERTLSISTLAGTFRPWGDGPAARRRIGRAYVRVALELDRIRREGGRTIRLALEPEPGTTLETAADAVAFWSEHLLPAAREALGDAAEARALVRRHLGVNLDTAHAAALFRRPAAEIARLGRAGIGVASLHLANALELRRPARSPAGLRQWRALAEPRYLHQWCAADGCGRIIARALDLGAPGAEVLRAASAFRVHFHVPIHRLRLGRLWTTRDATREALRAAVRRGAARHIVMETYTWPLLEPAPERRLDGMAREYRWVLGELAALAWRPLEGAAP